MRSLRRYPLHILVLAVLGAVLLAGCELIFPDDANGQDRPEEGFVEVNGARIFYAIQGEGTPLVLVHGYPLDHGLFREQLAGLSDAYRVVTLDLRGYGQSTAPGEEPEASIATYADDVLDVMSALGIEEALIGGMSMGGPIVFSMYEQAPERFLGMLLIDTIAAPAAPQEAGLWRGFVELIRERGVEALPEFLIDEMLTGEARMDQPDLVAYLSGLMTEASEQAAISGAQALASRPDFRPLLETITVPTLVLVGLQDTVYPFEIARRMHEMIPTSELVIIDDASHAAIIEGAERANEAIRSWADDAVTPDAN